MVYFDQFELDWFPETLETPLDPPLHSPLAGTGRLLLRLNVQLDTDSLIAASQLDKQTQPQLARAVLWVCPSIDTIVRTRIGNMKLIADTPCCAMVAPCIIATSLATGLFQPFSLSVRACCSSDSDDFTKKLGQTLPEVLNCCKLDRLPSYNE